MRDAVSEWQALSALYEQAETLTAPELDLWLERLRREANPLVGPLQEMLGARADVRANGFLSALPKLPPGAAGDRDDRVGERIGPYRLEAPIGFGGMAEVWRAERVDGAFRRTVAVKLLFRHVTGARGKSFAQRFDRERDILASLDHPNIAGLHDAGVTAGGQPWLALEYVEGEPLTAWCDRARIGLRARVALFRQVLLAVEHAHANLVIHRDLKPANILVSAVGDVRLLDFGIAKLLEADGGALDDTELTRHAGRLMTVAYASPEQLTGRPLTTATDVYSLGVVLYELLCGERPYEVRADIAARLEQAILEIDPRPPSRRALGEAAVAARGSTADVLRKTLAPDLDAIVLKALSKQPAKRYGSVEALRVELDRWLAGDAVEARTPSRVERLGRFVVRHPVGVGLGGAAVLALCTIAAVAVVLGLQARQESARATAARDFMMGMFQQADADKSHGADVTARELLDRGRDDVLRRLTGQPALQADLLEGIAGIQSSMGEFTKADVTLDALVKLQRRQGDALAAAKALAARADNAVRLGRLDLAESLVADVNTLPRSATTAPDVAAKVSVTRGWLLLWSGNPAQAKAQFLDALGVAERAFGRLARPTLAALVGVVDANAALHDFDGALASHQELASRQLAAPDKTPREVVENDVGRTELLFAAGRFGEAASLEASATPHCAAALGAEDAMCRRLAHRGVAANVARALPAAVRAGLPVLEAMASDPSSPDARVAALTTQFRALSLLGELSAHADVATRLRALVEPSSDASRSRQATALQALAEDALRNGDPHAALPLLRRAVQLCEQGCVKPPGVAIDATTHVLEGAALLGAGHADEALAVLASAEAIEGDELGASHPQVLLHSLNRALALERSGRTAEALALVDRARPVLSRTLGVDAPTFARVEALRARLRPDTRESSASTTTAPVGRGVEFFN